MSIISAKSGKVPSDVLHIVRCGGDGRFRFFCRSTFKVDQMVEIVLPEKINCTFNCCV